MQVQLMIYTKSNMCYCEFFLKIATFQLQFLSFIIFYTGRLPNDYYIILVLRSLEV